MFQKVFIILALGVLLFALVTPKKARGQISGGTIQGTVRDKTNTPIVNAGIAIQNIYTGEIRALTTNSEGFYSAPSLQAGSYEVRVDATGFSTKTFTGLELTVGETQVLDAELSIAGQEESVEVRAVRGQIELASSAITAVADSLTVRELPLNGRSWTDLALLEPGVADTNLQPAFNNGRGQRGYGTQFAIGGSRPDYNNYRLDGISLNDYANGGPGNVLGASLGVDAIREFSVDTSTYSAEYGRTAGGVINAVSRSGTNTFHGDAYEFLRNNAFDARNFFDGPTVPPLRRNQFGASAGGPIKSDKTFFFADYEGLRESLGQTVTDVVPTPAALAGNLCSIPNGSCTPQTVTVDPTALAFIKAFYPLPNGPALGNGDTGKYSFAAQRLTSENFFTSHVDHHFSPTDYLSGSYLLDDAHLTQPDEFNDVLDSYPLRRQMATIAENHLFNTRFLNSARFGYSRSAALVNLTATAVNPNAASTTFGAIAGRPAPDVRVPGITEFTGGLGAPTYYDFHFNSFQYYDDLVLTRSTHSIKFGANVERIQDNALAASDGNGVFRFPSLQGFLTNQPNRFDGAFPATLTGRGFRQTIFGTYIQDDWRARPSLTLNLGLRYEIASVPTEVNGKLSVLRNISDPTPHLGSPYFSNPTHTNFEPRVGFSWDPFHSGKTAVRGAFGMYDVLPLVDEFNLVGLFTEPFFVQGFTKNLAPGDFPAGAFAKLNPNSSLRQNYIQPNPGRNYVMQWNFDIERALSRDLSMMIGYVGSRGIRNPFRADDIDMTLPVEKTSAGYIWPNPIGSGNVINPNFGDIRGLFWDGRSYYDSLQFRVNKVFSHGFQAQTSFTWSKSIDTSSGTIAGDPFTNSIPSLPWFDLRIGRGPSDFNMGRVFVENFIWQAPKPNMNWHFGNWALGGWQLGSILKVSDGVPFTMVFGGDPLGENSSDPWDFPNVLHTPGCSSLVNPGNPNNYVKTQCFALPPITPAIASLCDTVNSPAGTCLNLFGNEGRNKLTGPGLVNLDFSVFKNNYVSKISETFNVQFRAEVFNILNHANFAPPLDNNVIFDQGGNPVSGAGLIDATATSSRQIQLALKVIW